MSVDGDAFRAGMRRLPAAVNVLTTMGGGEPLGMTVTAVCSVSVDPPSLLVCIDRAAKAHDAIAHGRVFCVNVLVARDMATSRIFSSALPPAERFAAAPWKALTTGSPALLASAVSFDCRVSSSLAQPTHTIFIGEVVEIGNSSVQQVNPLIYYDREYYTLGESSLNEALVDFVKSSRRMEGAPSIPKRSP